MSDIEFDFDLLFDVYIEFDDDLLFDVDIKLDVNIEVGSMSTSNSYSKLS